MVCLAEVKSHHISRNMLFILLDNSFIELMGSNLKIWGNKDTFYFYEHT